MGSTQHDPGSVLFGKSRRAVLGLLLGRPDERFHLRAIVRHSGTGVGAIQRELKALTGAGILVREHEGRQTYYRANPASPLFQTLRGLVLKTVGLAEVVRRALSALRDRTRVAFLYGSAASGELGSESDVDLIVLGDASFADVVGATTTAEQTIGRAINPVVYPVEEFRRRLAGGHRFLRQVLSRPKLFLIGAEDDLERLAGEPVGGASRAGARGRRGAAGDRRA